MNHAGVDSSELTNVRAAKSMGLPGPGSAVAAKMAEAPIDDALFGPTNKPQGRPRRARHVLVPGEDARRKQGALGLLQGRRHHPGS